MKTICDVYKNLAHRISARGFTWSVKFGRKQFWQNDNNLITSGARIVLCEGRDEDNSEIGEIGPAVIDIHGDVGQNIVDFWQTATILVHAVEKTNPNDELVSTEAVLGVYYVVVSCLHDLLSGEVAGQTAKDGHYYRLSNPKRVDNAPDNTYGKALKFEVAVAFAIRRGPEKQLVTGAKPALNSATAVTPNGDVEMNSGVET